MQLCVITVTVTAMRKRCTTVYPAENLSVLYLSLLVRIRPSMSETEFKFNVISF